MPQRWPGTPHKTGSVIQAHEKMFSAASVIKGVQCKTTTRHYHTLIRAAVVKGWPCQVLVQVVEEPEFSDTADGSIKWYDRAGKVFADPLEVGVLVPLPVALMKYSDKGSLGRAILTHSSRLQPATAGKSQPQGWDNCSHYIRVSQQRAPNGLAGSQLGVFTLTRSRI